VARRGAARAGHRLRRLGKRGRPGENLLEAGTASTSFFENLRATLVDWRERFLAAQDPTPRGSPRWRPDRSARPACPRMARPSPTPSPSGARPGGKAGAGACPADQRRAAFTRADGLIGEIDALLRDRQQQQLLQLDPSPAQPGELGRGGGRAARSWPSRSKPDRQPRRRPGAQRSVGGQCAGHRATGPVGSSGGVPRAALDQRLTERLQARARTRGRTAVAFLVSLLQITVPLAGVLLLLTAVVTSGMVGPQTTRSWRPSPGLRWRSTSRSGWPGGCSAMMPTRPSRS
jgi:potassium efflux system protein